MTLGVKVNGGINSLGAQTITPGTANKTIAAGNYLAGAQTISGDANLIAANIAMGKSIFGVTGNYGGNVKTGNLNMRFNYGTYVNYIYLDQQTVNIGFTPSILILYETVRGKMAVIAYLKDIGVQGVRYSSNGYTAISTDEKNALTISGSEFTIASSAQLGYIAIDSSIGLEDRKAGYIALP